MSSEVTWCSIWWKNDQRWSVVFPGIKVWFLHSEEHSVLFFFLLRVSAHFYTKKWDWIHLLREKSHTWSCVFYDMSGSVFGKTRVHTRLHLLTWLLSQDFFFTSHENKIRKNHVVTSFFIINLPLWVLNIVFWCDLVNYRFHFYMI